MGDTEYYTGMVSAQNLERLQAAIPNGSVFPSDLSSAAFQPMKWLRDGSPSGTVRSNLDRYDLADLTGPTSGVALAAAVYLFAGDVVTNLTFASGATAAGTPTHWWFALYDTATVPNLISQSADQTSTAWGANTAKTLALGAPYTVLTSGFYQAVISVTASAVPSLCGLSVPVKASSGLVSGQVVLAQTSGSALGATAAATLASPSTVGTIPYVVIN